MNFSVDRRGFLQQSALAGSTEAGLPVWLTYLDLKPGKNRVLVLNLDEPICGAMADAFRTRGEFTGSRASRNLKQKAKEVKAFIMSRIRLYGLSLVGLR